MKTKSLLTLSATFILACTQLSCLKKQNLEEFDLGPAVDANVVQNEMITGVGSFNINSIKINELSQVTAVTTYEDAQTIKVFNQSISVDAMSSTTTAKSVHLNYSKQDFVNSQNSFNNIRYTIDFDTTNDSGSTASAQSKSSSTLVTENFLRSLAQKSDRLLKEKTAATPYLLYRVYAYMALYACREAQTTCYNFKFTDSEVTLNPELADPRICANTLNCKVPVRRIEFDLVDRAQLMADGKPTRSHYNFLVSNRLPFFSKVLQYCVRGLVDYNDRKILAEDCVSVNNFIVGD